MGAELGSLCPQRGSGGVTPEIIFWKFAFKSAKKVGIFGVQNDTAEREKLVLHITEWNGDSLSA